MFSINLDKSIINLYIVEGNRVLKKQAWSLLELFHEDTQKRVNRCRSRLMHGFNVTILPPTVKLLCASPVNLCNL